MLFIKKTFSVVVFFTALCSFVITKSDLLAEPRPLLDEAEKTIVVNAVNAANDELGRRGQFREKLNLDISKLSGDELKKFYDELQTASSKPFWKPEIKEKITTKMNTITELLNKKNTPEVSIISVVTQQQVAPAIQPPVLVQAKPAEIIIGRVDKADAKKDADAKKAADKLLADAKVKADKVAADAKKVADAKAKKDADAKKAADKLLADAKAKADKVAADTKKAADKVAADAKAKADKAAADLKKGLMVKGKK